MSQDISSILRDWPLDEATRFRKVAGDDGRERVQIRVCVQSYHGILQFECDGRPDGARPHDCEFALDYWQQRVQQDPELRLSSEQAKELFEESGMVYQRYVVLLQLEDFQRVIRDTERNMRLFRFMNHYAADEDDCNRLEKWWPYILRIHHTARGLLCLGTGDFEGARQAVRTARDLIGDLAEMEDEVFQTERQRSLAALDELAKAIEKQRPLDQIERLEQDKNEAVRSEQFELAAELRDRIAALKKARQEGTQGR